MIGHSSRLSVTFAGWIGRSVLLASLGLLLGCAANSDVVQVGSLIFEGLTGSNTKIPRETAAAVPYATMGIELGASPQVLLILGSVTNDELDWFAGEQVFVATRQGRVIRTAGLPYNLGGVQALPAGSGIPRGSGSQAANAFALDFPDLGVFGAGAQCSSRNAGDEDVEILGARIATRHIVEHCEVSVLRWKFDNDFWQDRMSGYIWRSRQYIHPKSPPIVLEVLRPEEPGPG